MTTTTTPSTGLPRLAREGYGPGAWHGPDLKAALSDVSAELAFHRPAPDRHNIAEIALHHAYTVRSVRGRLSASALPPFVLDGEDWFVLPDQRRVSWARILEVVETEHRELMTLVAAIEEGSLESSLPPEERLNLVLGVTCHACYHAGQVQLIKRLTTA